MYTSGVDVAISTLRAGLSTWIERARSGEEVIVTDRGVPVARLVAVDSAPLLDRLTQQGVLSRPVGPRPVARDAARVRATGSVSNLVGDERR
jgi:prevent-host-death family protein